MGRFRAVPAVTSQYTTLEESLASGKQVVELLQRLGVVGAGSVVLQLGSGIGRVEYHLASLVRFCYGADISPAMVERARRNVPRHNTEFRCTSGRDLHGWEDRSLDLIYSIFVFQHLPREQVARYLKEAFVKLRPGGWLVFQLLVDENGVHPDPPDNHPYALRYYRRLSMCSVLEREGFVDVSTHDLDGSPDHGHPEGDVVFAARRPRSAPEATR